MRILITGSTGFLGRHLSARLKLDHQVVEVHSKNCDLKDPTSLNQFNAYSFDQIYHLAAWTQAGDFCLYHPGEQWVINQKINTHILSWWQERQPQAQMVCMGTSCSYSPEFPLEEAHYLNGTPIESLFTYAMTKRMLLCGLQALHTQYGLSYLYLIPSTLYGPGYHTDSRQLHFIFDLIRKILMGYFKGDQVTLWGNGEQKRELVHVDDFIEALLYLVAHQKNCHLNIGAGQEYSIKEFAQVICEIVGFPYDQIQFDVTKYVGAKSKVLNIATLKKILPSYSPRPLQEGLQETVHWFQNQFFPEEQKLEQSGSTRKSAAALG